MASVSFPASCAPQNVYSPIGQIGLDTPSPTLLTRLCLVDSEIQACTLLAIRAYQKVTFSAQEELIWEFSKKLKSLLYSGENIDSPTLNVLFDLLIDLVSLQGYRSRSADIQREFKECFLPTSKFRMPMDSHYICSFTKEAKKIDPKTVFTLSAATHAKALKACEVLFQQKRNEPILLYAIPSIANHKELTISDQKLVAQLIYDHCQDCDDYEDHLDLLFIFVIKEHMPLELRSIFLDDICTHAKTNSTIADRRSVEALTTLCELSSYADALDGSMIDTVLNTLSSIAKDATTSTNRRPDATYALTTWAWSSSSRGQPRVIEYQKRAINTLLAMLYDKTLPEDLQKTVTRHFNKLWNRCNEEPSFGVHFQLYCDLLASPQLPSAIKLQLTKYLPNNPPDKLERGHLVGFSERHKHSLFSLLVLELGRESNSADLKTAYVRCLVDQPYSPELLKFIYSTHKWKNMPEDLLNIPAIKNDANLTIIVKQALGKKIKQKIVELAGLFAKL